MVRTIPRMSPYSRHVGLEGDRIVSQAHSLLRRILRRVGSSTMIDEHETRVFHNQDDTRRSPSRDDVQARLWQSSSEVANGRYYRESSVVQLHRSTGLLTGALVE